LFENTKNEIKRILEENSEAKYNKFWSVDKSLIKKAYEL
jgi:hypothetical protein